MLQQGTVRVYSILFSFKIRDSYYKCTQNCLKYNVRESGSRGHAAVVVVVVVVAPMKNSVLTYLSVRTYFAIAVLRARRLRAHTARKGARG